jgi:hypothetical protein
MQQAATRNMAGQVCNLAHWACHLLRTGGLPIMRCLCPLAYLSGMHLQRGHCSSIHIVRLRGLGVQDVHREAAPRYSV